MMQDLKVGIVDDSPLIRQIIQSVVDETPGMRVVGQAGDPFEARDMIKEQNPDVITLDVEMPRMNGLEFLEKIMKLRPMPVVMVSTLTQRGADVTLRALEIGAVDYIAKPDNQAMGAESLKIFSSALVSKLNMVKGSNFAAHGRLQHNQSRYDGQVANAAVKQYACIGIASSTGGIERLRYLISNIRMALPPILIVQHINHIYVQNLVERLQELAPAHITVKAATHREALQPNHIYIADNQRHLQVRQLGNALHAYLLQAPARNGFVASADYLFESLAALDGLPLMGVVLSGMGNDGAAGLQMLRKQGAMTLGENEKSCLVYGMPKAAFEAGAIEQELSLEQISAVLNQPA